MKCVICRVKGAIRAPHLLALLHSSWQKSCDSHSSIEDQDLWEARGLAMSHSTESAVDRENVVDAPVRRHFGASNEEDRVCD